MDKITMKCGRELSLSELDTSKISYVPCNETQPLLKFASFLAKRQHTGKAAYGKKWNAFTTAGMTGVQLMCGMPSYKRSGRTDYLYYNSLDIEARLINEYPEVAAQIQTIYRDACQGSPCIIRTKSGGLRLDAYTPYCGKKWAFKDDGGMLLEVLANKCLARIDPRYTMLSGSVLEMPTLPKEALQEIHGIISEIALSETADDNPREVVERSQIGDLEIEWGSDGRSQLFPTQHCQRTDHRSNRDEVRFTKHRDGSVDGKCFNCGETWWEIPPKPRKPIGQSIPRLEPIPTLPPGHPIIASAPTVEVQERPSYPYFSPEHRILLTEQGMDPDAGWHYDSTRNIHLPSYTPKYEYLNKLLPNKFAINGHPREIEKRRVWATRIGKCAKCGGDTLTSIDRYLLTVQEYCDSCHEDISVGSYVEYELNRKLPNSIVSDFRGYLSDDPAFQQLQRMLWTPKLLTYLGAAMGSGKTYEIARKIRNLAKAGRGIGIIAVPRVSLAVQLLQLLRAADGSHAWGGFFEGAERRDTFVGDIGAVVCLPSLPNALKRVDAPDTPVYLAIDEIDFAYQLTALAKDQATSVKKAIKDCLDNTGLVIAGQTSTTLALEALIEEFEPNEVHGFYNTAARANGAVTLQKVACDEGMQNAILASVTEEIENALKNGQTPYVFCATRRDAQVMTERFKAHNPLPYDAYTKLFTSCQALLKNQKLTEHGMLIATSAACVGISIKDPNAHTIIATGLNHGSRQLDTIVQEAIRVRNPEAPISIHSADYNFSLPMLPSETVDAVRQHERIKQAFHPDAYVNTGASKYFAYSKALLDLADTQPETYIKHHLGNIGNREITEKTSTPCAATALAIQANRKEMREQEKTEIKQKMLEIFNARELQPEAYTRRQHTMTGVFRIAHEKAAQIAVAMGWNDKAWDHEHPKDSQLDAEDTRIAIEIVNAGINSDALAKQRRGYLALHYPHFIRSQFMNEVGETTPEWVDAGEGRELHAINMDEGVGLVLNALLKGLEGKVLSKTEFAETVLTVVNGEILKKLKLGHLCGAVEAKRARFLYRGNDAYILKWTRDFIQRWSPFRVAKNGDHYTLAEQKNYQLRINAFNTYVKAKGYTGAIKNTEIEVVDLPKIENGKKMQAFAYLDLGFWTQQEIAEKLDVRRETITRWNKKRKIAYQVCHHCPNCDCQFLIKECTYKLDVTSTQNGDNFVRKGVYHKQIKRQIFEVLREGALKTKEIVERVDGARQKIQSTLKNLVDTGEIIKIKRGVYSLPRDKITETEDVIPPEFPDPNADLKNNARFRREAGETIRSIAEALEIHRNTVSKWCKGIKPPSPAQREVLGILSDGAVWKRSDIEARSRFAPRNITSAFNALLEADKICKPRRGYYQKK